MKITSKRLGKLSNEQICRNAHIFCGWIVFFFSIAPLGLIRMHLPSVLLIPALVVNGFFATVWLFSQIFRLLINMARIWNGLFQAGTNRIHLFYLLTASILSVAIFILFFGEMIYVFFGEITKNIYIIVIFVQLVILTIVSFHNYIDSIRTYLFSYPIPIFITVALGVCFSFDFIRYKSIEEVRIKEFFRNSDEYHNAIEASKRKDLVDSNTIFPVIHSAMYYMGRPSDIVSFERIVSKRQHDIESELVQCSLLGFDSEMHISMNKPQMAITNSNLCEVLCMKSIFLEKKGYTMASLNCLQQVIECFLADAFLGTGAETVDFCTAIKIINSLDYLLQYEDFFILYQEKEFHKKIKEFANGLYRKNRLAIIQYYARLFYDSSDNNELFCTTDEDVEFTLQYEEYINALHARYWSNICSRYFLFERIIDEINIYKNKMGYLQFFQYKKTYSFTPLAFRYKAACLTSDLWHHNHVHYYFERMNSFLLSRADPSGPTNRP